MIFTSAAGRQNQPFYEQNLSKAHKGRTRIFYLTRNETIDCDCHVNHVGVQLPHRSLEIFGTEFSNHFHRAFAVETRLVGLALQRVSERRDQSSVGSHSESNTIQH